MQSTSVRVEHNGDRRRFAVGPDGLAALLRDVAHAFALPENDVALAFQTPTGDRAAVSTDFALHIVRGADPAVGILVVARPDSLLTVDQCMHTVLSAVVDTAARGEVAAVFLALSGAWEQVVREFGQARLASKAGSTPTRSMAMTPSPSSSSSSLSSASALLEGSEDSTQSLVARSHRILTELAGPHSDAEFRLPSVSKPVSASSSSTSSLPRARSTSLSPPGSPMVVSPRPSRPSSPSATARRRSLSPCNLPDSASGTMHITLTRALEKRALPGSSRRATDAGQSRDTVAAAADFRAWESACHAATENRAVVCFCTHVGVSCAQCKVSSIRGTRYRCTSSCRELNLCERCRRSGTADGGSEQRSFMVYDHPWEASDEYADADLHTSTMDALKAPLAPLEVGDVGPRVMHLHYMLYRVGYVSLFTPGFRVGVYCKATREAIARFQRDHRNSGGDSHAAQDYGVYNSLTRLTFLCLFDELELRWSRSRCATISAGESSRARLATAMAA